MVGIFLKLPGGFQQPALTNYQAVIRDSSSELELSTTTGHLWSETKLYIGSLRMQDPLKPEVGKCSSFHVVKGINMR